MAVYIGNKNIQRNPANGYSGVVEHSGPVHSFLEHSTLLIFPFVLALNFHWAGSRLYELGMIWLVAAAIPLGIVGGDLVSGIVHWAADTYGSEETPLIGPSLVRPFRLHHVYPRDICTHGLVELTGNVCILAVPVLSVTLYLLWLKPASGRLAFAVICLGFVALATVATNQFHRWAHEESPSAIARLLQQTRLVLEPQHHQLHHTRPFDTNYCITNGWLNPVLNKLKFFRRLEAALKFFGIKTATDNERKLS